jgi:sugar (pentulose or hexulose) kinase
MDPPPVWIGLDVGTQSVRAIVVAADGEVLGRGAVALRSVRQGERHEQDPRAWWEAVAKASRAALRGVAPERVRGVAACATSGTVLLVDRAGVPLTPGVMYDDARASEQAERLAGAGEGGAGGEGGEGGLRGEGGEGGEGGSRGEGGLRGEGGEGGAGGPLGLPVSASWALPKVLWMVEVWPELARGARVAHQADVVTRALVGEAVPSDSSHALKTGYDQVREAWPRDALAAAGVPDGLLPDVVRSGTRLGVVCARAAAQTLIPEGTPVIAGMTDGCAAQLAAGALGEGDWNSVLGTTLVLKGRSARLVHDPRGVLYSHRAPDGGWLPGGASSTGAGVLSERFAGRDLDELGARAQTFEETSVLAYPLVSRGERFPFAAPAAEAFVLGEPNDEAELFAALLQGVAFVERLCFDYVDLLGAPTGGELTLTGGGTRSPYWCQLRADVLGRPVRLVEESGAAFGMALLAASSGGDAAETAARMVRTRDVIQPRADRAQPFIARYLRLVEELERRRWLGAPLAEQARKRAT